MRWTPVLLLPFAIACGSDGSDKDDATPAECDAFDVTLGEGNYAYEPRATGESMSIVHGVQGGRAFHIAIGGALVGASGSAVTVSGTITELSQGVVIGSTDAPAPGTLVNFDDATCTGEFFDARILIDDVDIPGSEADYQRFICTLRDNPIQVDVDVTDTGSGDTVTLSWTGVIAIDASNDC